MKKGNISIKELEDVLTVLKIVPLATEAFVIHALQEVYLTMECV